MSDKNMYDDEEMSEQLITLVDEEGNEHDFELIDYFEFDEQAYAVLVPLNIESQEDAQEGEAIILRVEKTAEGEEILVNIEDDDEWEKAAGIWMEIAEEDDND